MTREEAVEKLKKLKEVMDLYTALNGPSSNQPYIVALEMSIEALENQKIGHWVGSDGDNAICSCCNRLNHLYGTYCKHCGARMQ